MAACGGLCFMPIHDPYTFWKKMNHELVHFFLKKIVPGGGETNPIFTAPSPPCLVLPPPLLPLPLPSSWTVAQLPFQEPGCCHTCHGPPVSWQLCTCIETSSLVPMSQACYLCACAEIPVDQGDKCVCRREHPGSWKAMLPPPGWRWRRNNKYEIEWLSKGSPQP